MPKIKMVSLIVSSALLLAACGKGDKQGPGGMQMPPSEVSVVTVSKDQAPVTFDLSGRVVAVRAAEVRARVEGILEKRLFAEGGEVKAGQSLFRIDPRTLEANLASAKAALAKAEANALIASQTVARYRVLAKEQGVSKQELDQAEAQFKQTEAEVAAQKAAVTNASINLSHASVIAPISGRIGRALVTEGALVGKGEATHLATIEQLDPIHVNFTQSSGELLNLKQMLKAGQLKKADSVPVELTLENGTAYPQRGKLLFSEQTVDPATGTVTLRAEFPNPDRLLLPGMFATIRVALGKVENAVRVPQRAVTLSPQGASVYVVDKEGKVAPVAVKTGGLSGKDWLVTGGLEGGEQVVVEGLQKVRPGAVVKPVPFNASAAAASAPAASAPAASAASAAAASKPAAK
ncbi:membrane fusion protein, multidrug efflux system [Formivibrio citricus]|uniref:Membrane fusion protein, multidrug efflux system n=1 Tax=Formivibrio citricus TaxID=83765 RepID=A0A1I5B4J7_9NEIS|nr:efflux RND transporter periplasmic adaptor subunit [Formivibrio citricus]SFN69607.1 membrane fusion protein, multidrug efflux system [Formivibrio citricus]